MQCEKRLDLLPGRTVWALRLPNRFDGQLTLLLSKVSEAVLPRTPDNHIGAGATMDDFLRVQQTVRFIINGGFNHYRRDFYAWPHREFHVGDPVGLVKIRNHYFEDVLEPDAYGFFVQKDKGLPWDIVGWDKLDMASKYILGCTPMLVKNGARTALRLETMAPAPVGSINPPSVLGHGLQRHPRTAVGIKGDQLVFLVVEGGAGQGCTYHRGRLGLTVSSESHAGTARVRALRYLHGPKCLGSVRPSGQDCP